MTATPNPPFSRPMRWGLTIFWLALALLAALLAVRPWLNPFDLPPFHSELSVLALALGALAALALAVALAHQSPWARPVAAAYHWLLAVAAVAATVALLGGPSPLAWPAPLANALGPPPTPEVVAALGGLLALLALLPALWLERSETWRAFRVESPPDDVCPTCGSTRSNRECPYCQAVRARTFFLRPALSGVPSVPLVFRPGHLTLRIGRANDADGRILNGAHTRGISNEHALIRLPDEQWLNPPPYRFTIEHNPERPGARIDVRRRRLPLDGPRPYEQVDSLYDDLQVGDLIRLAATVEFLLTNPGDETRLAYWWPADNPRQRTLLVFDFLQPEWVIGRDESCDVVINDHTISGQHAIIIFNAQTGVYQIGNKSRSNPLVVMEPAADGSVTERFVPNPDPTTDPAAPPRISSHPLPAKAASEIWLSNIGFIFEPVQTMSGDPALPDLGSRSS